MRINNKGFTLVELLATMAILAVLMLLAIPNVIGIVQSNKNKTYVEDAKKLVTLAEYKIRSDPSKKPSSGGSKCLKMSELDLSKEIDEPPNGGQYDRELSYVKVINSSGTISYRVQLVENKDSTKTGIKEDVSTKLYADDATTTLVKTTSFAACS